MTCLFSCKKKSPSPSPKRTASPRNASYVLPLNMWRKTGNKASPKERASLARVFGVPKKRTLPLLKIHPVISRLHRVINRSRATAKPVKVPQVGLSKLTLLNKINPSAYKNLNWKYYIPYNLHHAYFSNSTNGPLFMINSRGARKNVSARLAIPANIQRKVRKYSNTWNNYLKRAESGKRYAAGASKRTNKYLNINKQVDSFLWGANRHALNNISIPDLMYWASKSNMMSTNGQPYHKRGGKWYPYGSNTPVNKAGILKNIKMYRNIQRNANINNNAYNPLRNRNYN